MELMALVLAASAVLGEEKAVDLKVGDVAPAFTAKDDAGKDWKSADHVGKMADRCSSLVIDLSQRWLLSPLAAERLKKWSFARSLSASFLLFSFL